MRGQAGRPCNEDYLRFTDSDDEYFQEDGPSKGPSDDGGRGSGAPPSSRGRKAGRRRYGDAPSSDEEGDEFDDDLELGRQSTESQRRARRRLANRECARRIRQKKLNLVNSLTERLDALQRRNEQLLADLAAVAAHWRDLSKENCDIQADLAMAQALRRGQGRGDEVVLLEFNQITMLQGSRAPEALGAGQAPVAV